METESATFHGVRISPREIVFKNAYQGKEFREKLILRNVSKRSVTITTLPPNSSSFKVDKLLTRAKLSTGLNFVIWINYTYTHSSSMLAQMAIHVNDNTIEINLEVLPCKSELYCMPRNLNFGKINLGHAVHVEKLMLHNRGYRQSKFEFDLSSNTLGLYVSPRKGFIHGGSQIEVEVNLIGFEEGMHSKEIWVKCEHPFRLTVFVEVITPKLYICSLHDYTECFLPLMLPPLYGGCRNTQTFDVFNFNMLQTNFIIVPEYNFEIMAAHKVTEVDPTYKSFSFSPIEGDLQPSESRSIEISFEPPRENLLRDKVNFVTFRLIRLECQTVDKIISEQIIKRKPSPRQISSGIEDTLSSTSRADRDSSISEGSHLLSVTSNISMPVTKMSFSNFIRICVYAIVKSLKIEVEPGNFTLPELLINTSQTRFMHIINKSRTLPVFYEYQKTGYIQVTPSYGFIKVNSRVTVRVTFSPTAPGLMDRPIEIDFFYFSQPPGETNKVLENIGFVRISVYAPVKLKTTQPPPKFNMGITPQITNAVGFMTDDIRFNTKVKKPKMAIQQCYQSKLSKNKDNAKIAFPNDRPTALQPWRNKTIKCKTIFAEIPRVIAPEDEYMFNPEELRHKIKNDSYYLNYIRFLRRIRAEREHKVPWEDYITTSKKLLQSVSSVHCPAHWKKIFGSYYKEEFTSLKPIQIYFVAISPFKIFFQGVVVNTTISYSIDIFNENIFPVHILITYFHRHRNVLPGLPLELVVKANEKITVTRKFSPNYTGLFSTILNVYLNRSHFIPILLQAQVVRPFVSVDVTEIIFGDKDSSQSRPFPLRNKLNVPVAFSWDVPSNSSYTVNPMTGVIPPSRFIYCEVVYTPNLEARNCVKLTIDTEDGSHVHIHVSACYSNCQVEVLQHKIIAAHIPLNILTERKNILRNQGLQTVLFQIRNPAPCYGVTIKPERGSIPGRSDVAITITFLFEVFVKFDIKVEIEFEYGTTHFVVVGQVDLPMIACKPKEIEIKRTPAESFEIVPFCIENKGESVVHLSFPKWAYPEITVSGSRRANIPLTSNIELQLESKETAHLYIHFHPLDVCMNTIYLPIVLNHKLGPAEKYYDQSLYAETFLDEEAFVPSDENNIKRITYDKIKMTVFTVSTVSTKHILRFSKTLLNFKHVPTIPSRSVTVTEVKIKNCVKEIIEFCIDITGMEPHFDLSCKVCEYLIHRDENIMAFLMNEEEELTLTAYYKPSVPGEYDCNLPIYIKHVKDENIFNYIKMHASYPPPTFISPRWCFLEPVPLNTTILYDLNLLLCYHFRNCTIEIESDLDQLNHTIKSIVTQSDNPCRSEVCIQLRFKSKVVISECTKIKIKCSCEAHTFLILGVCAADDIISTFTHYCANVPFESPMRSRGYPYFPEESDNSEFAIYMRKCVTVTERWIYEQALNQTYYYCIPEDMSGNYRVIDEHKRKSKSMKANKLVLMQILANLGCANEVILPCPKTSKDDDLIRVNELHCNLKHILVYLHQQGAYIPHVRSRYLLSYDDYVLYMTKIRPMKEKSLQRVKPEELYYRRSKQCWLNLILSIFKILVLARISIRKTKTSRKMTSLSRESSSLLALNLSPEQSLLMWLDTIYHEEIDVLLLLDSKQQVGFTLPAKTISNFTSDLSNGLVLIAVTVHFCPYLIPYLQNIYVDVNAPEKAFHNAVLLVEAWKLVNCSFKITPSEIVNPMALQMVFLAMYMFDIFYTLSPKEELNFSACLSKTETQDIMIRNPNNNEITLEICFLGNKFGCFHALTTSNIIKIPAAKSYNLKIEYMAKKIEPQTVILILSGETPGHIYSKSIVYTLTGKSNFLGEHQRVVFEVDLYKSMIYDLEIQSPYIEAATYECYCAKLPPQQVTGQTLVTVKEYLSMIRPRTLYAEESTLVTDENGFGTKRLTICCLSTNTFNATIVFKNAEVGEFFLSIEVQPINFDRIERHSLIVNLPVDFDSRKCNCCGKNQFRNPKRCGRRMTLHIPCKNDQFWNIIIEAIMLCISPNEKQVWNKFLANEMGPHILHWLMSGSQEIATVQHMIASNIIYMVNNNHSEILLPSSVTIENVRSDNFLDIDMHIVGDISHTKSLDFALQSIDGTEIRWYSVEFRRPSNTLAHHRETKSDDSLLRPLFHSII